MPKITVQCGNADGQYGPGRVLYAVGCTLRRQTRREAGRPRRTVSAPCAPGKIRGYLVSRPLRQWLVRYLHV